ncbi:MAG: hypothetical protein LUP94_03785 [Candidatus Methanomethylicus sp.]|nr:hypothetical protein [Candidatus Methanomethylicus sp.]
MRIKFVIFAFFAIIFLLLASNTLAPSIHVLQGRTVIIGIGSQDSSLNGADLDTIDEYGLLELHSLQATVGNEKGEAPILLIRNNFPERIEVETLVSNSYLNDLSIETLILMPGEEAVLLLNYDTASASAGIFYLGLLMDVNSQYAHVSLYRVVQLEVG